MHRFIVPTLLLISALSGPVQALTADELIAKNITARGGLENIQALKSLQMTGKLIVNQGRVQLAYKEIKKSPESVRVEYTLQGLTGTQAYDGTQAWQIDPFQGRKDPEKMSVDDAKGLVETAEIEGSLVNYRRKGSTVEYMGIEDVDGTPAHKLKVIRKDGDLQYIYLDPDYFLEIRIVSQRTERGAQVEVETDLGDYEKVAGVYFPFALESGAKGQTDKSKILYERGESNLALEDALFQFPAAAK